MLDKEDYIEPRCPLCLNLNNKNAPKGMIPVDRVISKLDEYYETNDILGAERHLNYWLNEALSLGDKKGEFTVRSELMGHYRKQGNKDKAIFNANAVYNLIDQLDIAESVGAGTAYINIATVYKAFSLSNEALPIFNKAFNIFNKKLDKNDVLFGGLYNNMALALVDQKEYKKAYEYYDKAISIMKNAENGNLDVAITYLNIATAKEFELGLEKAKNEIDSLLKKAKACLNDSSLKKNGYYAYVCSKCAPGFGYYGDKDFEEDLNRRVKEIYERS